MTLFYLNQYVTTTLSKAGGLTDAETAGIVLQSITGIDVTKPGIALLTYADPLDVTKAEWITYTSINNSTKELQGVTRGAEGSTAKEHDNGCAIAFPLSESHINNLNDMMAGISTTVVDYVTSKTNTDGWSAVTDSWSYASASTITVPSGAVAKYQKGDKIKLTQTTVKYFYIIGVADTVLTVTGGTDYTVASAAITDISYSHDNNPIGFPHWFNYTPTVGAGGSMTFTVTTTEVANFCIVGNMCTAVTHLLGTTGGSASNVITHTLPVTPADGGNYKIGGACYIWDAAVSVGSYNYISGTLQIVKYDNSNFAVTTNRRISTNISYRI